MARRLCLLLALVVAAGGQLPAQQLPPGYVDPAPVLAAASKAINEQSLRCITFSGVGYSGPVGQTFENAVNIDWQRSEMANYTRTINWETGTSKETFDRKPGNNPASWKYGLGWIGGTPTQANVRQTHIVNGRYAWHIDGTGAPVAVPPEMADVYQLDVWLNPHGFLKAARMAGANPKALWRWEQIEKGRDGNVVTPERVHVVGITVLGKFRVDATINSQNIITRLKATVNENVLGDFNIEQESTEFVAAGPSRWPINWHSHQGWDDNWQFSTESTGHNAYGGKFSTVQANACDDPVPVPESVKQRSRRIPRSSRWRKLRWRVSAGRRTREQLHVEFRDFVAVFERRQRRTQPAVIEQSPSSRRTTYPLLISSHPHCDHIGGLRTYNHIGATVS